MTSKESYIGPLSPEYALLGLISQKPAHGYELHQRLSTALGQIWHISLSQTYNILTRLETGKYITAVLQRQEKLPDRRLFHLTKAGKQRFENWLQASTGSSVRAIRVEFITRLYFASIRDPGLAIQLIGQQVSETNAGLSRLQNMLDDVHPNQTFNQLGLALRIRQLSSIIDWLEECRQAIEDSERPI